MVRAGARRFLVAWCPDWPVTAAGYAPDQAVAVVEHGRVMCASQAARDAGVRLGTRRREAEGCCNGLVVLQRDPMHEARAYEAVRKVLERLASQIEVVRPGLCALDARAAARYAGGEAALAAQVARAVDGAISLPDPAGDLVPAVRVGIADGHFAATLAAHDRRIVPPGRSQAFLASFPVGALGRPALVDLLVRLGITTLGELATLDPTMVSARLGPDGAEAHRLARGDDDRPLQPAPPPQAPEVCTELDPPVDRLETAAFIARTLAGQLAARLEERGLACARATISAETEHGERHVRCWRGEGGGGLDAPALVDRLRWQLEGWFSGSAGEPPPTAGLTRLVMTADEVVPATGIQDGFWGTTSDADRRAARAIQRLQGLLGPTGVLSGTPTGGRGPGERILLVPWGAHSGAGGHAEAAQAGRRTVSAPWPGRHPRPAPALVHPHPRGAEVVDGCDLPVQVSGRGRLSGAPARLSVAGGPWQTVVGWAGPWLADERWWDPLGRRRRARFQLVTADGTAHLCALEQQSWWVEATYD